LAPDEGGLAISWLLDRPKMASVYGSVGDFQQTLIEPNLARPFNFLSFVAKLFRQTRPPHSSYHHCSSPYIHQNRFKIHERLSAQIYPKTPAIEMQGTYTGKFSGTFFKNIYDSRAFTLGLRQPITSTRRHILWPGL
jgi:hypothetical protein